MRWVLRVKYNKIYLQLKYYIKVKTIKTIISSLQHKEHLTAVFHVLNQELGNTSKRLNEWSGIGVGIPDQFCD